MVSIKDKQAAANALRNLAQRLEGKDKQIAMDAARIICKDRTVAGLWTTTEERKAREAYELGGIEAAMAATGRTRSAVKNRIVLRGWAAR